MSFPVPDRVKFFKIKPNSLEQTLKSLVELYKCKLQSTTEYRHTKYFTDTTDHYE